jgi:hypothetical protein
MDLSKMFETESNYLKAADYPDMNKTLHIEGTGTDTLNNPDGSSKDVVWIKLKGASKPMVLSLTNGRMLVGHLGANSDDWIGKKVLLTTKQYNIEGKNTRGWVMMPIVEGKNEMDDEIPF